MRAPEALRYWNNHVHGGRPRLLNNIDDSARTPGQVDCPSGSPETNENKRNPLKRRPQDVESAPVRRTQSLVVCLERLWLELYSHGRGAISSIRSFTLLKVRRWSGVTPSVLIAR